MSALFTVIDDNLIVLRARDEGVAVRREVDAVDAIGILAEHLGDFEAAHDLVNELHLDDRGVRGVLTVAPRLGAFRVFRLPNGALAARRRRLVHLGPRDSGTGRHNGEDARPCDSPKYN